MPAATETEPEPVSSVSAESPPAFLVSETTERVAGTPSRWSLATTFAIATPPVAPEATEPESSVTEIAAAPTETVAESVAGASVPPAGVAEAVALFVTEPELRSACEIV